MSPNALEILIRFAVYFVVGFLAVKGSPGVKARLAELPELTEGLSHEDELDIIKKRRKARSLTKIELLMYVVGIPGFAACAILDANYSVSFFGFVLIFLLWGACSDLFKREVPNFVAISIAAIGFVNNILLFREASYQELAINLGIALVVFVSMTLVGAFSKGWGGADTKICTALAFFNGTLSVITIMVGLMLSIIYGFIDRKKKCSIPLIAFVYLGDIISMILLFAYQFGLDNLSLKI